MAAIELVCREHTVRKRAGSGVTFVDGLWAYCAGDARQDHGWERVPPTHVKTLDLAMSVEEFKERAATQDD